MKWLIAFIFLYSSSSFAISASVGTHVPYFNQAQVNVSGSTQKLAINPYFGIGTNYQIYGRHYFLPELAYSYYLDNPSGSRREVYFLHFNFGYVFQENTMLRYGLTTNYYRIIGKGGNTELRNGTDSSQSFPNPNKTVTTHFTTLNLGAEQFFSFKSRSVRFDLNLLSFKNIEHTSCNYLLTMNFYL